MIRVRLLQSKDEQDGWYDDSFMVEDEQGNLTFHYNLTWGRVGARINGKLKTGDFTLEEIEAVLPLGENQRWLDIVEVKDDQSEVFLEELDERCAIPKPRSVRDKVNKTVAA